MSAANDRLTELAELRAELIRRLQEKQSAAKAQKAALTKALTDMESALSSQQIRHSSNLF